MGAIKTYGRETREHKNLELAAAMMTMMDQDGLRYWVGDCYFDMGQDWMWTTIIGEWKGGLSTIDTYQALYPADHEKIVYAETVEEIKEVVDSVMERKVKTA